MPKVRPITPEEVVNNKSKVFPAAVFEAFNDMITQKFSGNQATFKQKDVVALMKEKGLEQRQIFDQGFLDVEDVYRKAGWTVEYDKPGYNESYPATFTFKRSRK